MLDNALFFMRNTSLDGVFVVHVDDFIFAGNDLFHEMVVQAIIKSFQIGQVQENVFKYLGLNVTQCEGAIAIDQIEYVNSIEMLHVKDKRGKLHPLTSNEVTSLQSVLGQVNWVATQTRPDLSFDVLELSMSIKNAQMMHISQAKKMLLKLKNDDAFINFPALSNIEDCSLIVYTDASFANLPDKVSSARGYLVFLVDSSSNCCLLSWASNKIKRVVKSTTSAECLALLDGLEDAFVLKSALCEMFGSDVIQMKIVGRTDHKNLYDAIHSSLPATEKILRIDLAVLKEMLRSKKIDCIERVSNDEQLADVLTKKGVNNKSLLNVVQSGKLYK